MEMYALMPLSQEILDKAQVFQSRALVCGSL
jgi:hypothetical protein